MSATIIEQNGDRWLLVSLDPRLDAHNAPRLAGVLQPFISAGGRRVIFDCARLQYVSSAGLREFIAAAKKLKSLGGSCAFAALSPMVGELFTAAW